MQNNSFNFKVAVTLHETKDALGSIDLYQLKKINYMRCNSSLVIVHTI